jgi:hypothetical protein
VTAAPTLTPMVTWISKAAVKAGLSPNTGIRPYRGAIEIHLDAKNGPESTFGAVTVGVRTGRVLRGFIRTGNDGTTTRYNTGAEMLRALHNLHQAV